MYIWDDRDLTVKSGDKNFLNKNGKKIKLKIFIYFMKQNGMDGDKLIELASVLQMSCFIILDWKFTKDFDYFMTPK